MRKWAVLVVAVCCAGKLAGAADNGGTYRAQITIQRAARGGDNANVVIWLSPLAPTAEGTPPPGHFRLVQRNKQFEPHLLVIPVGSVVDFPNQDPFFHNVFSLYKGKRFDLGLYEAGGSRTVHFDRPGVSFIFCNIHPEMSAVVLAMSTPYYAVSGPDGEVVIRNIPPGKYRLEVWYERSSPEALQALTRDVTISGDSSPSPLKVAEVVQGTLPHKNKYGKDYDKTHPYNN